MRDKLIGCAVVSALLLAAQSMGVIPASATTPSADESLYLVTLEGPGTAAHTAAPGTQSRTQLLAAQDDTLEALGADEPVYRWTTALNGFAVELTAAQAAEAHALPEVALVQRDAIRPLAGSSALASAAHEGGTTRDAKGGDDAVIGIIDTGISTSSPALAGGGEPVAAPRGFRGTCRAADSWGPQDCNHKVIAATWFVDGFGADKLRSGSSLSPVDDTGHGTQVASIAAGNDRVSALASGRELGTFSGSAPGARISVYKACWSAPDPEDDGCSTADVVSAVDRAVADRVDVLNLSVGSGPGLDTVDLALLGAAEADVFVATAAGNGGDTSGYQQPWVTTVGATSGRDRSGALRLRGGPSISGILTARRLPDRARVIRAADAPAPGHARSEAALCAPGSLDAGRTAGRIVLCERGQVARVDKSAAVDLADGVAMVLVNASGEGLSADFHSVPTLHVSATEGAQLRRALRGSDRPTGKLVHTRGAAGAQRVMGWSARGHSGAESLKPDLVAPGFGVLAASVTSSTSGRWGLLTGTSASAARVSGLAARIRAAHPTWSAARVRSALVTSARPVAGTSALRQGAGIASARNSARPGLVFDLPVSAYRRVLERGTDLSRLNLPSAQRRVPAGGTVITRRVTNVGPKAMYYSSSASGFDRHQVQVTPAAIKIAPGETKTFEIRVERAPGRQPAAPGAADSGTVTWRGANGIRVRVPVLLRR